jgi:molybdopterin synthase sulfur carrier subunit
MDTADGFPAWPVSDGPPEAGAMPRYHRETYIEESNMAIIVRIPTPLQKFTKNQSEVQAEGTTVQAVLEHLDRSFPGIRERLCDEHGAVRRFINLYLNDEDIRFLEGEKTVLKDGDELAIIPAIAGGKRADGATCW